MVRLTILSGIADNSELHLCRHPFSATGLPTDVPIVVVETEDCREESATAEDSMTKDCGTMILV